MINVGGGARSGRWCVWVYHVSDDSVTAWLCGLCMYVMPISALATTCLYLQLQKIVVLYHDISLSFNHRHIHFPVHIVLSPLTYISTAPFFVSLLFLYIKNFSFLFLSLSLRALRIVSSHTCFLFGRSHGWGWVWAVSCPTTKQER